MARALPWLLGGGAVAAYLATRTQSRRGPANSPSAPLALPGDWVWPVPSWKGRAPVVSDGFNSPRPGVPRHGGVDVMFKRLPLDTYKAGTPNASRGGEFVMPNDVAVLAASDGVVWSAMQTPRGFTVVIDHGPRKVTTFYTHLDRMLVTPTASGASKQLIRAGQMIGTVGFSPLDGEKLRHLHFELWLGGPNERIDPQALMRTWEVRPDPREALVARNASLVYRPIGERGEPYPQWVRDLRGASGVYVIREVDDSGGRETVYVGSSSGRLYDTLTRHFQRWRRWKGFWNGQYGEGHDPGLTYARGRVEVAVRLTSANASLDEEMRMIRRLKPRDNLIGQAEAPEDTVPF